MNEVSNNGLLQQLDEACSEQFKPIPFWSINSCLDKVEIVRQIREMNSYGLGGFVFHARTGLKTEYLSDEWFDMVSVALSEAKKLNMQVWIYDENGWPSGFVGGKLLEREENRACYLQYETLDYFDASAYAVYEYSEKDGVRLLSGDEPNVSKYHTLYKRVSDSYCDILNPAVTEQFIACTHEKYYERFKDSFGKELVGFFTDEPQYYRYETPFPSVIEEEYFNRFGKSVKDGLLYLFLQDEKGYPFRVEYYNLVNELYSRNFYKMLMDWCEAHGCLLTGHSVEETLLSTQMWGGADCATTYEYEHLPAIDNLEKNLTAEISAKTVGSVAMQLGKKLIFTETFGTSGYSTTPKQLKQIADKQYVYGVNMMIQHLYNYSLAGQGKIDCPPSFGRTMPWIDGYYEFNKYFEKLGYLISNSTEFAPVAVLLPTESVYLDYLRLNETKTIKTVDEPFVELLSVLRRLGVAYHFVNEKILQKIGSVKDGKLVVGQREYSAVVVGGCREIKNSTLNLLKQMEQTGSLCVVGCKPEFVDGFPEEINLLSNTDISDLIKPIKFNADGDVSYTYREFNGKRFLFVVNQGEKPVNINLEDLFFQVDIINGREGYSCREHTVLPHASILLEEGDNKKGKPPVYSRKTEFVPEFKSCTPNNLTIERVTAIKDTGEELCGYVYGVFETLMKTGYSSLLRVKFEFDSQFECPAKIIREKQKIIEPTFNGENLSFRQSAEDVNFEEGDITVKEGKNVYEYVIDFSSLRKSAEVLYKKNVPESILNANTHDTGMEQIYVLGDFDVEEYTLKRTKTKSFGDLTKQGLPDFYGSVKYKIDVEEAVVDGYFKPIGEYSACVIRSGGRQYRCMMNEGVCVDLDKGEVEIECYSTLRNRFGPFHFGYPFDDRIFPDVFTMRGLWNNEKTNKFYYEDKRRVPFGLELIEVWKNEHRS